MAIASFIAMHCLMARTVDPVVQPVSGYALAEPGNVLFPVGALSLTLACAAVTFGPELSAISRFGLFTTAGAFLLVTMFRTDSTHDVSSLGGEIHRYAAAAAFTLLTATGVVVALRLRHGDNSANIWRRLSLPVLAALAVATLLLTAVNTFIPDFADGGQWRGIPQRILLLILCMLIMAMARFPCGAARVSQAVPRKRRSEVRQLTPELSGHVHHVRAS